MKRTFKQKPRCEVCGKGAAISFSRFNDNDWKFTCECTTDSECYYVMLDDYFASSSHVVDWHAHLHEKTWMDWSKFMAMMHRFRKATRSFF